MKLMKLFTLILTVVLLKSCGNTQATTNLNSDMLTKQSETLSGLYTVDSLQNFKDLPEELTLEFDNETNKISGYSGCNHFFGTYTITGNSIAVGPIASTKKMCIEKVAAVEQHMISVLDQINTFSLEDGVLTLKTDNDMFISASKVKSIVVEEGKPFSIAYSARSRGVYKMVTFEKGTISYKKDQNSEAKVKVCVEDEIERINESVFALNLSKISKLEPPSTAHQYDGALMGRLIVDYGDEKYETNIFDHGNPPAYISNLVAALISISEMD